MLHCDEICYIVIISKPYLTLSILQCFQGTNGPPGNPGAPGPSGEKVHIWPLQQELIHTHTINHTGLILFYTRFQDLLNILEMKGLQPKIQDTQQ